jgi:hypothetical protein
MRILAIDLAWSGPSGWVFWDLEGTDPVLEYGEFQVQSKKAGIEHDQEITWFLYQELWTLIGHLEIIYLQQPGVIAYEYTDWHRSLKKGKEGQEYAIERRAQRTLGMAVAVISMVVFSINRYHTPSTQELMPLGANEARREFGATRKDSAAHLFAEEYPRFEFMEHETGFLFDKQLERMVSNHVSDAFVLAAVAARRLKAAQMIEEAENGMV